MRPSQRPSRRPSRRPVPPSRRPAPTRLPKHRVGNLNCLNCTRRAAEGWATPGQRAPGQRETKGGPLPEPPVSSPRGRGKCVGNNTRGHIVGNASSAVHDEDIKCMMGTHRLESPRLGPTGNIATAQHGAVRSCNYTARPEPGRQSPGGTERNTLRSRAEPDGCGSSRRVAPHAANLDLCWAGPGQGGHIRVGRSGTRCRHARHRT